MASKIYASLLLITKREIQVDVIKKHLRCSSELVSYFHNLYNVAYSFFYNNFFYNKIENHYMGYEYQYKEGIGSIRLDYVLVTNKFLNLNSIHIHFNFITANKKSTIDDTNNILLKNICTFLKETRSEDNPEHPFDSLFAIKKELYGQSSSRKYTYPLSKYLYTSLCGLEPSQVVKWKDLAKSIWAPLYLHYEGVKKESAFKKLSEDCWASTDFFVNFFQPGALVSISNPFPTTNCLYHRNHSWFSGQQICKTAPPEFKFPKRNGWKGEDYDLLPEYPPLKYLGLLPLELSGYVEENLRYLYDVMLDIQQSPFPKRLWRSVFELSDLEALYYKTNNQECLRLPTTREYSVKLRDNKIQENIYENLKDLKASMLNGVMLLLAIIAITLTLFTIVPQCIDLLYNLVDYVDKLQGFFEKLYDFGVSVYKGMKK